MMEFPPFCGDDRHVVDLAQARVAVLPVPYEGTVSYGAGASRGPTAILAASAQLEMYDEELDRRIDEAGIVTLPPVLAADSSATPESMVAQIAEAAREPLTAGKLLVTLGGEHTVTVGVLRALAELRELRASGDDQKPLPVILQIDAHADLRDSYQGTPFSHACVMARAHELGFRFVQVGIRSLSAPERVYLREQDLEQNVFWAHEIARQAEDAWIAGVLARLEALGAGEVYLTVDVDGLDPSIMPATGTPEPGGLHWYPTLRLLRQVSAAHHVVGLDITELASLPHLHAADFLAARLTYKMIGYALAGPGL